MLRSVLSLVVALCILAGTATTLAGDETSTTLYVPEIYTDYCEAYREAAARRQMLLIYFHRSQPAGTTDTFESKVLLAPALRSQLENYVVAKLPVTATSGIGEQPVRLLSHPAFSEMLGLPGVAIIDLAHVNSRHYGHVVSVFPFKAGRQLGQRELGAMLDLPPGSLTQRTLIFAVRIHPERPASVEGRFSTLLASESEKHSRYQAALGVQGHHNWDQRFQSISARIGMPAQEVCAESWPGQDLVEAALECVDSWRQSPGHWNALRSRAAWFGFDMKRGRNGIWYGTGIFARH